MKVAFVVALLFPVVTSAAEPRIRVVAVAGPSEISPVQGMVSDPDVRFWVEPLYPLKNNSNKAKLAIYYVCQDEETGGIYPDCWINLETPVARENAGGHYPGHQENRPTGRHYPSTGWTNPTTGRFETTFFSGEVAGVVDVKIHCSTGGFGTCRDGNVSFGVGFQDLAELSPGRGYLLTGSKEEHPSNHWGVPDFVAKVSTIADKFADTYPNDPLSYNDISLELGGVFDVRTASDPGYDWSPPHKTHRDGKNMDMSIPRTVAARNLFERLARSVGVTVYREDAHHWHLIY